MENKNITAIEEELRNYQIISNGGIVNSVKIGNMGVAHSLLQDEIFRCKKLQEKHKRQIINQSKDGGQS